MDTYRRDVEQIGVDVFVKMARIFMLISEARETGRRIPPDNSPLLDVSFGPAIGQTAKKKGRKTKPRRFRIEGMPVTREQWREAKEDAFAALRAQGVPEEYYGAISSASASVTPGVTPDRDVVEISKGYVYGASVEVDPETQMPVSIYIFFSMEQLHASVVSAESPEEFEKWGLEFGSLFADVVMPVFTAAITKRMLHNPRR